MNVFSFTGNLGKDCQTRFTPGGDAVTSFAVAVKSGYGDKAVTTWANCAMWGKRGEAVAPYLLKGALVGVSGELTNREYTDKDGAKRYSLDVRVNDLTLLGGKGDAKPREDGPRSATKAEQKGDFDDFESDIAF